jgi:hypothetical protein
MRLTNGSTPCHIGEYIDVRWANYLDKHQVILVRFRSIWKVGDHIDFGGLSMISAFLLFSKGAEYEC